MPVGGGPAGSGREGGIGGARGGGGAGGGGRIGRQLTGLDLTRGFREEQRAQAPAAAAAPGESRAERGLADVGTPGGQAAIAARFRPSPIQGLLDTLLGVKEKIVSPNPPGLKPFTRATFARKLSVSPVSIGLGIASPALGGLFDVASQAIGFEDPFGFDIGLGTQTRTAATVGRTSAGGAPTGRDDRGRDFLPPPRAPVRVTGPIPSVPAIPSAPQRPRIGVGTTLLSRGASPVGPANIRRQTLLGA